MGYQGLAHRRRRCFVEAKVFSSGTREVFRERGAASTIDRLEGPNERARSQGLKTHGYICIVGTHFLCTAEWETWGAGVSS
jgi:hypothetical protein